MLIASDVSLSLYTKGIAFALRHNEVFNRVSWSFCSVLVSVVKAVAMFLLHNYWQEVKEKSR